MYKILNFKLYHRFTWYQLPIHTAYIHIEFSIKLNMQDFSLSTRYKLQTFWYLWDSRRFSKCFGFTSPCSKLFSRYSYQLLSVLNLRRSEMRRRTDSHSPSLSDRKINDVSTKNNALPQRTIKRLHSWLFTLYSSAHAHNKDSFLEFFLSLLYF